ncbi:MAG TPA: hypothetical protein VG738_17615 [Chitinophagaceae bacterium]|nr:hypothetical protein [Chitinophagaceae bacterium]
MPSQSSESDNLLFEINLLFKNSKNAIEAFSQMAKVYQALNDFYKRVIRNISPNLICEYGLENVEFGSLKTRLNQLLKAIPDDILKELELKKVIGYFLIKIKYWLIKLLADEKEIISSSQLQKVSDKVNNEIKLIGENYKLIVTQINNYIILNAVDDITKEVYSLKEKELLEYRSNAGNAYLAKGVFVDKAKILTELGQRTLTNDTTEILKIKKSTC